jgi:hypothetical protein
MLGVKIANSNLLPKPIFSNLSFSARISNRAEIFLPPEDCTINIKFFKQHQKVGQAFEAEIIAIDDASINYNPNLALFHDKIQFSF